jgi:hypothetical protein
MSFPKVFAEVLRSNRITAAIAFSLVLIAVIFIYKRSHVTAGAVVYNEEYAGRFAADMCRLEDPKNTGCPVDARAQESEFASRFSAAFAGDPLCSGLRLVIYGGATQSSVEERAQAAEVDAWIMVNFNAGKEKQNWDLTSKKSFKVLSGEGDAAQTSHQVCAIVKGRGGAVN